MATCGRRPWWDRAVGAVVGPCGRRQRPPPLGALFTEGLSDARTGYGSRAYASGEYWGGKPRLDAQIMRPAHGTAANGSRVMRLMPSWNIGAGRGRAGAAPGPEPDAQRVGAAPGPEARRARSRTRSGSEPRPGRRRAGQVPASGVTGRHPRAGLFSSRSAGAAPPPPTWGSHRSPPSSPAGSSVGRPAIRRPARRGSSRRAG
jgi:hypothetical protein